jgi:hypothetical protein
MFSARQTPFLFARLLEETTSPLICLLAQTTFPIDSFAGANDFSY